MSSPVALNSIPTDYYQVKTGKKQECKICRFKFRNKQRAYAHPGPYGKNHLMHLKCIKQMGKINGKCCFCDEILPERRLLMNREIERIHRETERIQRYNALVEELRRLNEPEENKLTCVRDGLLYFLGSTVSFLPGCASLRNSPPYAFAAINSIFSKTIKHSLGLILKESPFIAPFSSPETVILHVVTGLSLGKIAKLSGSEKSFAIGVIFSTLFFSKEVKDTNLALALNLGLASSYTLFSWAVKVIKANGGLRFI